MKIEKLHEFHDLEFSQAWSDKFKPTIPRLELFDTILAEIQKISSPTIRVLELGIGSGPYIKEAFRYSLWRSRLCYAHARDSRQKKYSS